MKQVMSLDVADKIQVNHFAEPGRFLGQFGAFVGFRAVAQYADPRIFVAQDFPRVNTPHDGKMQEVSGPAFHAGPGVEQDKLVFRRGNNGGDARPVQALPRAKTDGAGRDDSAGIAREIKASALFSLSKSTARRMEQSFLRRKASTGLSSMVSIRWRGQF